MSNTINVLVIEDEAPIRRFLRASLPSHGYHLIEAENGEDGLLQAAMQRPAIIILDLGLPDLDGLQVTQRLREWTNTPIIVLSARGREDDKIAALDAGADDYLTKPFGMGELLARLRVALRHLHQHGGEKGEPVFQVGALRVDLVRRQVFVAEQEVHLTPNEYNLLTTLVQHAGKVMTHRQLLREVWGPAYTEENHYLRVYMGQLRHKLEADPARPRYLLTEPGVGYRLAIE
ncbi:MAG TPA: DNA-binding response regulator [Herpetosiphon sp.]|uniref:Transcriptional regulatory protein KdpE n=1 Tax=Herpetosiphon aurantiacus (strain ATCC 23779 / DSM 785 / 114-95) TaxID=316274 RepID=A9AXU8_HERA2|nr:response regulator [Herpetosiphon sp.]ABX04914.1 two component transcriptional regulator, winged helix family [Herpetosiphon aurantiacus DSM 785]HBW50444.1 DNA-binding response regulator [Herpetosiphon sp.]